MAGSQGLWVPLEASSGEDTASLGVGVGSASSTQPVYTSPLGLLTSRLG